MKKQIIFLIFTLCCGTLAQASIRIIRNNPATATCNGSIIIEASGTAGPFRVQVSGPNGYQFQKNLSTATDSIGGLCNGTYQVQVFNAFGCAKTLNTTLGTSGFVAPVLDQRIVSNLMQARAFPNPFERTFQVELQWEQAQSADLLLEVRNAIGQLVVQQNQVAVRGINRYQVEIKDDRSLGMLHVTLRDKNGNSSTLKVVQVGE